MRALLTGPAGFIGSHLAEYLLERGDEVVGVDSFTSYYDTALKRINLSTSLEADGFTFVEGDVNELDLASVLDGIDVVFHLAGQPGVRVSWGREFEIYVRQNLLATQRMLEAVKEAESRPRFVFASSSSIYGQAESFPTSEDVAPHPVSPYGMSKLGCEHLCHMYGGQFGVEAVMLRYFSIFGPRQRPDMAFTRFIEAGLTGTPITVNGDGQQSRDFTYVMDAVRATVAGAEQGRPGVVYNVAGGCHTTVMEVVGSLSQIMGRELAVEHLPPLPGDPRRTGADVSRAKAELDYEPRMGLEDGLAAQLEEHLTRR